MNARNRFDAARRVRRMARLAPRAALIAVVVSMVAAQPAYAYVDPSVMTYAIQALAGVVVALSAVAGVAFRKTRRAIFRALGIDENARKEVEPDVHRVVDGVAIPNDNEPFAVDVPVRSSESAPSRRVPERLRWRVRFAFALAIAAFCSFTLFVVAPIEIVSMSADSLVLGLEDVAGYVVAAAVVLAIIAALALSALRGRAFATGIMVVAAVGVMSWVQAMFLNGGLPIADGAEVVWGDFTANFVASAIVWVIVLAAAVFAGVLFGRAARLGAVAISVALVIVQAVGVGSIMLDPDRMAAKQALPETVVCTEDGLFELSSKSNVVMMVLDTYDTQFLDEAFADDPSLRALFEGFTYYRNSTGSMIPTAYAVPYLLTGERLEAGEPFGDYLANRYLESDMLSDVSEAGYSIGVYSDSLGLTEYPDAMRKVAPLTMNLHPIAADQVDPVGTVAVLAKCALYRDMPWALKPGLWFYTDEVNDALVRDTGASASTVYQMDDVAYYEKLRDLGLSLSDDAPAGAFRMIHLLGYHYPYVMNENGEADEDATALEQSEGALRIAGEYLNQMKKLGVFDSSTVIITADHGKWYLTDTYLDQPTSPIILYKPAADGADAGSSGSVPLRTSDAPVGHVDLPPTIIGAVGGDVAAYGDGNPIDAYEGADPERRRLYDMTISDFTKNVAIAEYAIEGDVSDMANWHLTGTEWKLVDQRSAE